MECMLDQYKIVEVEYKEAKQYNEWIYLKGHARLILENEEEVFCIGGIIFSDKL